VDVCSLQLPVSSVLLSLFVALHYSLSDDTNLNTNDVYWRGGDVNLYICYSFSSYCHKCSTQTRSWLLRLNKNDVVQSQKHNAVRSRLIGAFNWHVDQSIGLSQHKRHDPGHIVVVVIIRSPHRRIEWRKKRVWFRRSQCSVGDIHGAECATSLLALDEHRDICNTLRTEKIVSQIYRMYQ